MNDLAAIILAAGQGTRMKSKKQKILHEVGGAPMVQHLFDAVIPLTPYKPLLVVGPGEDGVRRLFGDRADYAVQEKRLGTGHAVMVAKDALEGRAAQILVAYADMPLLRAATLCRLALRQQESGAAVVLLSVEGDPASSFGRVARDEQGRVREIVEAAQAQRRPDAAELMAIREQNAGVYCFDAAWLWSTIDRLPLRQARSGQEYYLTDMIGLAVDQGRPVEAILVADPDECLGAGTRRELVAVECAFRRRANDYWLDNGVTLVDPAATYIDQSVTIGQDTVIWPGSYLQGDTHIGEACVIGPNVILRDARVGHGCRIEQAVIEGRALPDGSAVAPFTDLRRDDG